MMISAPTAPSLMTNVSKTTNESQESALTLCQAIYLVVFHPDAPAFSLSILTRGPKWHALMERSNTVHAAIVLTKTAALYPATPAAIGSGKRNSNQAQQTDNQTASPSPTTDPENDVTLIVGIGGSDGNSDYVELAENLPVIPANMPVLVGHIRKL